MIIRVTGTRGIKKPNFTFFHLNYKVYPGKVKKRSIQGIPLTQNKRIGIVGKIF
ncbi:hypothetical protein TREAZ_2930 [Leadbettera azotonutricia ZAS-9]|uniref:Uncharacterized protein n=1 Tax=Leadbettera azotonutricia (strain ATCC BAA-888 / DSM 13862 / ZAS-9) TaxID=545695 RepID=F5YBT6_LEAAZ|nr:hypothetical protein TREAZ_2930 [Leadbettera azotonutricia ZAS-9]